MVAGTPIIGSSVHVMLSWLQEIVVGSNMDKIYIVMDYVEHDLKSLMETMKEPFMIGEYIPYSRVPTDLEKKVARES